jgi:spermidine synthase
MNKLIGLIILTTMSLSLASLSLAAKNIHKERSIYRNIVINETKNKRCMRFETRRKSISNQACIDLDNQDRLVFEYAHSVMSGLAYNATPNRILIIGLGGGSLSRALAAILPTSEIVSVEIDPAVVKLAKQYFFYQETSQIKTSVKDGRVYIKRALKNNEQFDWIILDAFNGDYIPEHLLTVEFLTEAKQLLSKNGLLAANTFTSSRLYDYESVTYQKAFGALRILNSPTKGNRVIFACNCEQGAPEFNFDQALHQRLLPMGVDLKRLLPLINENVDWDTKVPALTDQFSPANLLNQ